MVGRLHVPRQFRQGHAGQLAVLMEAAEPANPQPPVAPQGDVEGGRHALHAGAHALGHLPHRPQVRHPPRAGALRCSPQGWLSIWMHMLRLTIGQCSPVWMHAESIDCLKPADCLPDDCCRCGGPPR